MALGDRALVGVDVAEVATDGVRLDDGGFVEAPAVREWFDRIFMPGERSDPMPARSQIGETD